MAERFKQGTTSEDRLQLFCNKSVLCKLTDDIIIKKSGSYVE